MMPHDLFPDVLPYNEASTVERLKNISKSPTQNFIQGKALEFALADHLSTLTTVVLTDEAKDNQWWDIKCLELKIPITIDCKSRSETSETDSTTYTESAAEQRLQFEHKGLFIWAMYIFNGKAFEREGVLARWRGQEVTSPPMLIRSTLARPNCELGWFWDASMVKARGTLALDEIAALGC